ncbi:MAG TPA: hypothetical protein DIW64_00775 [Cellvibrio sp.]|nr:hypothetical protein [Cellvibrio sp.]
MFGSKKEKYKLALRAKLIEVGCSVNQQIRHIRNNSELEFSEMCKQLSEETSCYYPRIRFEILENGCNVHLGRDSLASPYWEKYFLQHHHGGNLFAHAYECINETPRFNATSQELPIQEIVDPLNRKNVISDFFEFQALEDAEKFIIQKIALYLKSRELSDAGAQHPSRY